MNIKKIGLTALAASLVSVSAHAGSMSVAGGASMNTEGYSGEGLTAGTTFSMGNQLTFTGSGELDNGINVSLSFVIDQGDDTTDANRPFDSHSVKISSDAMGSLTLAGEGGTTATGAINASAAGNLWDAFDGLGTLNLVDFSADLMTTVSAGNNGFMYTTPELAEGLTLVGSYQPKGTNRESATGYGVNYTGFEGLTLNYATMEIVTGTTSTEGDVDVLKASYAYGPITVGYSESEYDDEVAAGDQSTEAYNIAYTISDDLSISYGSEELEFGVQSASQVAAEFERIKLTYTTGGMTLTASQSTGDNIDYSTTATKDQEVWALGATFAF